MSDIPKILITADAVGGIWTYALDLGRELTREGYAVHLATVGPASDDTRRQAARDAGVAVTDLGHAPEWMAKDATELAQAGEALAALARRENVDLIHLNHPALAADVRFDQPVIGICHSCSTTWWEAVKGTPLPDSMVWQKEAVARGYKALGLLVAPSRAFAEMTRAAYNLAAVPEVIHNGRAPVRDEPPDEMVETVFTSGRLWDEGKNVVLLDRVAALTTAPFRAAGPVQAPYGSRVELKYLDLLGSLSEPEIRKVLAERPVYVSAALYEPFRPRGARSRPGRLRPGAQRHPELPRIVGRCGIVRGPDRCGSHRGRGGPPAFGRRPARRHGQCRREPLACLRPRCLRGRHAGALPHPRAEPRGPRGVKVRYFTHSLLSCWNHGNAHFLRGVLSDLIRRGHDVTALEPEGNWSLGNLLRDAGPAGLDAFRQAYPDLAPVTYQPGIDPAALVEGADLVIMHEWNEPALVAAVGALRKQGAPFTLLFHDTHHRAVSDPEAIRAFDLDGYDGVLAFGETLAEVYRRWGWGDRVSVWHEAADTHVFHPPAVEGERKGLVWIGNWGDDERSTELEQFLFRPAQTVGLPLTLHGVRYPEAALATWRAMASPTEAGCPMRRPGHLRPSPRHRPRAAPLLRHDPARHPDHPGFRGARLRHPAVVGPMVGQRGAVRDWPRLSHGAGRGRDDGAPARRVSRCRPSRGARRERSRDDPRAPHLRAPRRGVARHRGAAGGRAA